MWSAPLTHDMANFGRETGGFGDLRVDHVTAQVRTVAPENRPITQQAFN